MVFMSNKNVQIPFVKDKDIDINDLKFVCSLQISSSFHGTVRLIGCPHDKSTN